MKHTFQVALIVLLGLFAASAHSASGTVKLGTYWLSHTNQSIGGKDTQFYEVPNQSFGFELDDGVRPDKSKWKMSRGLEVYHVAYQTNFRTTSSQGQLRASSIMFRPKWVYNFGHSLYPYAGAGLGLSFMEFSRSSQTSYFYSDEMVPSVQFAAGIELNPVRSRYNLSGEVRYYGDTASVLDASGISASIGFQFKF